MLKLKTEDFSRDPAVVAGINADPLIAGEVQPAKTVAALGPRRRAAGARVPAITLPVLIMHGTDDKVTSPGGSQMFFDSAGSRDKTLKLYEGHVHDLLNDVGKETAIGDVKAWLDKHVPVQG